MKLTKLALICFEVTVCMTPITIVWLLGVVAVFNLPYSQNNFDSLGNIPVAEPITITLVVLGGCGLIGLLSMLWSLGKNGQFLIRRKITAILTLLGVSGLAYLLYKTSQIYTLADIVFYVLPMICLLHFLFLFRNHPDKK